MLSIGIASQVTLLVVYQEILSRGSLSEISKLQHFVFVWNTTVDINMISICTCCAGLSCHNSYALEQEGPKSIPVFVSPKLQVSSERRLTPISKWGQSMSSNCRSLPLRQLRSGRPPVNKPHCSVSFTIFYFK